MTKILFIFSICIFNVSLLLAQNIDLSHWKVTLPISNEKGKPIEVAPPEVFDYALNDVVKPYMYNDPTDSSVVFYTKPNATTQNTKYSRTELREQLRPGSNAVNWSFKQGGRMSGELRLGSISKAENGKYHRTIVMQIHGRLTNEQRKLIGKNSNDAPPILKIYWQNEKIRVKTKILKNRTINGNDILKKEAWKDDEGFYFQEKVGFDKFKLDVVVSEGRLEVILNGKEKKVYDGFDMDAWSVFENYFKAGNYLQTTDKNAHCSVKYYSLQVSHPEGKDQKTIKEKVVVQSVSAASEELFVKVLNGSFDEYTANTSDNADAWDMTPNSMVIDNNENTVESPYRVIWRNTDLNAYIDEKYCNDEQPGTTSDGSYSKEGEKTRGAKISSNCRRLYQLVKVQKGVVYTFSIDTRSEAKGINTEVFILNREIKTEVGIDTSKNDAAIDAFFKITDDFNPSKGNASTNTFTKSTFSFRPSTDQIVIYVRALHAIDSSHEVFIDNIEITEKRNN